MGKFFNFDGDYFGLLDSDAADNLELYGYNLTDKHETQEFKWYEILKNPVFLLLISATVLYFLYMQYAEAISTLVIAVLYVIFDILKGYKIDDINYGISSSSQQKYRVIRNGEMKLIPKDELVPDDIIIVSAGENVPADAMVLEMRDLTVDEYNLTGDEVYAEKVINADLKNRIKSNCIYYGTRIMSGTAIVKIIATGIDTQFYKIGKRIEQKPEFHANIQKKINKYTVFSALTGVFFLLLSILFKQITGDTADSGIFKGISFALCFIPAEIGVVIQFFYLFGAVRFTKTAGNVRQTSVIEELSRLSVICVDKSGTITKNQMEVSQIFTGNPELMNYISLLSCDKNTTDIVEQAIILHCAFKGTDVGDIRQNEPIQTFPFSSETKVSGRLWDVKGANLLCVKGTPQSVLTLCDISAEKLFEAQKKQTELANEGMVVIAIAFAKVENGKEIKSLQAQPLNFLGLIALNNPPKDTVPYTIRSCQKAGIRVVMITGDNPETAAVIGRKAGIREGGVITGDMLNEFDKTGTESDITSASIFAAVTPEQKRRIINSFVESGEMVAVIGEKIDDIAAMESADIAVTNARSINAVCEAADIVMDDDCFSGIPDIVKDARRIFHNIGYCLEVILTVHTALFFINLLSLFGMVMIINPALMIVVTQLILPASCFMLLDSNVTSSELNSSRPNIFNVKALLKPGILGMITGVALFAAYLICDDIAGEYAAGSFSLCFLMAVIWSLFLIRLYKSSKSARRSLEQPKSKNGLIIMGVSLLIVLILIYVPVLNKSLYLGIINPFALILAFVLGLILPVILKLICSVGRIFNDTHH